jgi:tRNA-Thr(GGU) m(6)t(6)A37 methyltransferase TsaA
MDPVQLQPIGHMKTAFTEKFGTPRQSGLVPSATGVLKLSPNPDFAKALQQLEGFSHVWILFLFDRHLNQEWRPLIHPPRVLKSRTVGVLASRSPHRPNPIGLSAVRLERIDLNAAGGIEIHFSGVDLLDGTPVLDIKPYLPYTDSIPEAEAGWAKEDIDTYPVLFSEASLVALASEETRQIPRLQQLISEMLSIDPRPISQKRAMPLKDPAHDGRRFKFRVSIFDVEWQILGGTIHVQSLHRL